jgi:hypothetical protein
MRPFNPFTLRTVSGESYHVSDPELAWQSPGGQTVLISTKGEAFALLDIDHVTEIVYPSRKNAKRSE